MSWQDNMQQWLDYKDLDPDMKEKLNEIKQDDKIAEEAFYLNETTTTITHYSIF